MEQGDQGNRTRGSGSSALWWAAGAVAGIWGVRQALRASRRFDLDGRVAIVTGGSRGLGLELARQLLDAGARVAICARDADTLERARVELVARAGDASRVLARTCDVTDASQVCHFVSAVRDTLGEIDVLINNAAVIQVGPTEQMQLADYDEAMRINYYGPLHFVLAVAPGMRERRRGRIVNVASIGGKLPVPHLTPYNASKFALVGLSESLRVALSKDQVFVTTVSPGEIRTGSPRHAVFKGDHAEEYAWFTAGDTAPVMSMDTDRAARRILDACRHGDAELVMPFVAWFQGKVHGLLPGLSTDLNALIDRRLPKSAPGGETRRRGSEFEAPQTPVWAQERQARFEALHNQTAEGVAAR